MQRPDPSEAYLALDLALRAGEVLLAGGAGASDATATCLAVARSQGLDDAQCDVTFTSISMSWQPAPDQPPVTTMRLVRQRTPQYTRVTAVDNLVDDLVAGRIGRAAAAEELRRIVRAPRPYRPLVVTTSRALLAASVAVLLGAGPVVALAAFGATLLVDAVNSRFARANVPFFYQNLTGGFVATTVAIALYAADVGVRPALVVAGGIVLLLPGVTLVGAVQDAITGFYVTASARAFEAFLLTAAIISGVALALSIGVRLGVTVHVGDAATPGLDDVVVQLLAASVVSAAFAVSNHAPRRTVPTAAVAGLLGWGAFALVDQLRLDVTIASAAGAVVVGVAGYAFARRQQAPTLVYVAAGILPLLPGLLIYRGMFRFTEGETLAGITLLGQAVSVGLALAAGAIFGEFLAQPTRRDVPRRDRRIAGPRLAGPRLLGRE